MYPVQPLFSFSSVNVQQARIQELVKGGALLIIFY